MVSPGVPPDAPPLVAARNALVPIVSEVDVGFHALRGVKYAAISGTNGKTTTTALIGHLLQSGGLQALAAGNIGRPLSQVALDGELPEWIALELSSFQLHDTHDLIPAIGALTNLAPDHLDRYRALEDYYADKDRIFVNAGPASCWVTNGDDAEVERRSRNVPGTHLRFRIGQPADAWFDRERDVLMLREQQLLARPEFPLLGEHNVANALAAALDRLARRWESSGNRGRAAELPRPAAPDGAGRDGDGVLWINDSKATNVASTLVAVQAMTRPFILLLGGRHKGEPYTALARAAGERCRAVIAFGESRDLVVQDLGGLLPVTRAGTRLRRGSEPRPSRWPSRAMRCSCLPRVRATICSRIMKIGAISFAGTVEAMK